MLPPTQSCSRFLQYNRTGATLINATALPDFLCTRIALQSENHSVQKNVDDHGDNWIMNPVQKNSPNVLAWSIPRMQHPLLQSWQAAPTLRLSRNYFFEKNTSFHPTLWSVWISKFRCTGKKSWAILTLPTLVSHSLHLHLRLEPRSAFCGSKTRWVQWICNLLMQKTTKPLPFLFHLTWCSYKGITINKKLWELGLKKTKRSQTLPN